MNLQSKDDEAGKRELCRQKKEGDVVRIEKQNISTAAGRKEL